MCLYLRKVSATQSRDFHIGTALTARMGRHRTPASPRIPRKGFPCRYTPWDPPRDPLGIPPGVPQSPGFPRAWAAPPPVDPPTGSPQGNPKVELLWTRQGSKRGVTEATAPPPRASLPMWSPAVGAVVSRCGLLLWAPTVGPHGVHGSQISTHRGPPQKSNPTDTLQALPPKVTATV